MQEKHFKGLGFADYVNRKKGEGSYRPSDHLLLIIIKAPLLDLPNLSDVQKETNQIGYVRIESNWIGSPTKGKSLGTNHIVETFNTQ